MAAEPKLDTLSSFGNRQASFIEKLIWKFSDWPPLPSRLRQKLRKRFARPVSGPFDVRHEGMKFRLYPSENYCDRVLFGREKLPEHAEHEALTPLISPGIVFVDIGANVGTYSIYAGTRAQGDLVLVAIEPHPRTYRKLKFNLEANNLPTDNLVCCAVGPERSEMTLWSDGGSNIGHTSLLAEGTANAKVGVSVPVVPLADILRERQITAIDILKIDVEGFEDRALVSFFQGASDDILPNHILIETAHQHLWETDLSGLLVDLGYQESFATEENRLLSRSLEL